MNDAMFANAATQANLAALPARGWTFVGPDVGALAEGPSDRPGRMVEPDEMLAQAERVAPPRRTAGGPPGGGHRRPDPRADRPGAGASPTARAGRWGTVWPRRRGAGGRK